ncbi:TPA: hypothetical protein PTC18_001672, partial [Staphylococcus pseudintermedius]|nr:hypothetical protein [Staphylococcus pseudintermedius]
FVISPASHVGAFIITVICAIVGVIIYAVLTMRTRLADKFLGEIPNKIRRKVSFL